MLAMVDRESTRRFLAEQELRSLARYSDSVFEVVQDAAPVAVDGCEIAIAEGVIVVVWTQQATPPGVEHLRGVTQRVAAMSEQGFSVMHLIAPGISLPDAQTRGMLSKLAIEFSPVKSLAIVIPGTGFWASAMRSMVTGILMVSGARFEVKTFSTASDAAVWTAQKRMLSSGEQRALVSKAGAMFDRFTSA